MYDESYQHLPERTDKTQAWMIGCLFAASFAILICGGGAFAVYQLAQLDGSWIDFEEDWLGDEVAADIQMNPVILEHIGQIESCETDWVASGELPGPDDFVFSISGTRGSGRLTATSVTVELAGGLTREDITAGTLVLSSGEMYSLFPDVDHSDATTTDGQEPADSVAEPEE